MTVEAISPRARIVRSVERILLTIGVILLCAFVGVRLYGLIASRQAVASFQQKAAAGGSFVALRFRHNDFRHNAGSWRRGYKPVER